MSPRGPGGGRGNRSPRDPPREHPGSQPGTPEGAKAAPTPSSARTHALLPPPYGNLQPPKVTRRRFLGLAARPPPPGQRSCRGDLGGGADSSERWPGEEGNSEPRILRFLPWQEGARGAAPYPARSFGQPSDRGGLRSQVFFGHPRVLWGRERTRADSVSGRGSEVQGPESDCGWHVPGQPAALARLTSPQAETGLRAPAIRVAHAVPASRPQDPRRPLRRSRLSRRCSPPPPPAAAAAQITTRRV